MSSYAIMNENWMILSWVMLQSECDRSLYPMYEGLCQRYTAAGVEKAHYQWVDRDCCAAFTVLHPGAQEHVLWDCWRTSEATMAEATSGNLANTSASRTQYNKDITIKLDLFHCMRRFTRECVSEHHSLYSSFCQFLSAAFLVVDQADLQKLKEAYTFCNISPANPTKQHIREHCRTKVPQPRELLQRVEDVLHHFYLAKYANDLLLFKASMLKIWRIQRVHILRDCLSDPEVGEGTLYRYGGTLQLNYNKGEGAAVPIWIPVRGTSQQEGFHIHQAQWVTRNRVSCELFQAQAMTVVARWNFQRLVDLKLPGVELPAMSDPLLVAELNILSAKVTAKAKYPTLQITNRDTEERFGLHYVEPGCRPVLFNWDKNKAQTNMAAAVAMETKHHCSAAGEGRDRQETSGSVRDAPVAAVPILSCQQCTGPIKAGGLVQVLDHGRWTEAMRAAIDGLLGKHHRAPRMLKRVDEDYAAMPREDLGDAAAVAEFDHRQPNGQCTCHNPASCNPLPVAPPPPVAPPQEESLSRVTVEKIVAEILEKQQQQQQQQKTTWNCLACGQPKSRYLGDGSSVHFFFQSPTVKYFYCSTKLFKCYVGEGLKDPRMSSKVFSLYKDQGMVTEMTWGDFSQSNFYEAERERWIAERK
ncbi:hypothetical protein VZT92_008300 [Zoarces viviparus]|uniref:Uncharacterized protein n=1 Tax=Zoarces viviparus TaxID=48416 RepID=A0AAW1FG01_ZOAVI